MKPLKEKEKIFFAFLIYSFFSFVISVTSFVLFREIEKIDKSSQLIISLNDKIQSYLRLDSDFMLYEVINPDYFLNGKSRYLELQDSLANDIIISSDSVIQSEQTFFLSLNEDMTAFKDLFHTKEEIRKEIFKCIFLIGFKDYGYTGEMRTAAHYIEKTPHIDMVSLLMLRRHEKDYFLRNDTSYVLKHRKEEKHFVESIGRSTYFSKAEKDTLFKKTAAYSETFEKIIQLEKRSGYRNNTGLSYEMQLKTKQIDHFIKKIKQTAEEKRNSIVNKIQIVIVVMVTFSIVLFLILAVSFNFVSRSIS